LTTCPHQRTRYVTAPRLPLLRLPFSPSLPLPYLHSFPTRRSSDLGLFSTKITPESLRTPSSAPGLSAIFKPSGRSRGIQLSLCVDRKSTRLNSSHQIISYAVFCLKKKKKQTGITEDTHISRTCGHV